MSTEMLDRLRRHVSIDANGCWNWTGTKSPKGYALTQVDGVSKRAHRVIYELTNGPVPTGLQLDHLCRNRGCVNPDHLEPVTGKVNVLRGVGVTAQNAKKTHCHRGHPLSGDNIYPRSNGGRECWECKIQQRLKLSEAQRRALISARDTGSPTTHLSGQSAWGGWVSTHLVLRRRGFLDAECKLTDAGRAQITAVPQPTDGGN